VITPVSGPCDQVKNMDTGYLIQVQDTESILNTLVRIRENNSEAKRIGNNAREYVLEHLDMNKVIGGYEEIYTGLLGR
jgi:glycosyltransferase involved in cell wall biosynthesis